MALNYVNRTTVQNARNGTTSHTLNFAAATAGNLLVAILSGGVTLTTPTGWTLVASSVVDQGLYVWKKTASTGESSAATTANGSDYPIGGIVYEFLSGSTEDYYLTSGGTAQAYDAANPSVTPGAGKTGIAVVAYPIGSSQTWTSVTWSAGTEDFDLSAPNSTTGGYLVSGAWIAGTGAAFAPTSIPDSGTQTNRQSISLVMTVGPLLPAPLNLHTTTVTSTAASLAWNAVTGAAGYKVATAASISGWFSFDTAGRIFDPNGNRFIPVGVNANGPDWVWGGPTIGQSAAMGTWGFNTLRVNACFPGGCVNCPDWTINNDLDGLVTEYTSQHHVILVGQMQYGSADTISDANVAELVAWWETTAVRYKDNPYVWFNLINEPSTSLSAWYSVTTRLADAVRSVAPNNIIVVDGDSMGQDKGGWACDGTDWPIASAALNYGAEFRQRYGAVVFSSHLYGQWGGNEEYGCGTVQWEANLNNYIDVLQANGTPLIAGEFGSEVVKANEPFFQGGAWNATHVALNVLPARGIGMLFWHGDSGAAGMNLLSPNANWTEWSGDVGQLTWEGQGLYNFAQQIGAM